MILFVVIPIIFGLEHAFENMIKAETIVYIVNYLGTFFAILQLHFKKKMIKIPLWEIIIYFFTIILIFCILLFTLIPPIVNEPWSIDNSIIIISYLGSMLLGYLTWASYFLYKNLKTKTSNTTNKIRFKKRIKITIK